MYPKVSSSETVFEEIKKRILSRKYPPGYPLREIELAKEFSVSRTPVREALKILAKDDLVDLVPNKGGMVKAISLKDIKELFMIRMIFEEYCCGHAAHVINDSSCAYLEAILRDAEEAYDIGNYAESAEIGNKIHEIIARFLENDRIIKKLREIDADISRIQYLNYENAERVKRSNDEHAIIVSALQQRDSDLAKTAMHNHIDSVQRDTIFEYIKNDQHYS